MKAVKPVEKTPSSLVFAEDLKPLKFQKSVFILRERGKITWKTSSVLGTG